VRFWEYLPADYATSSKTYPLIIFAHGAGETSQNDSSTADAAEYTRTAKHGPPKHINLNHDMCFTVSGEKSCFIVISPQTPKVDGWASVHRFRAILDYAKANLRVDTSRIYMTGLSMGGGLTWSFARSQSYNPTAYYASELAAIVPIAGASEVGQSACNMANQRLPIWAFHGTADSTVDIKASRDFVNAINGILANGVQCTPNPKRALLTEYAGVGHDSWSETYKPTNRFSLTTTQLDSSGVSIYEWMLSHSR
jgi:predicted peptidase